jgi:hypothetical protein
MDHMSIYSGMAGVLTIVFGVVLILTREWSAEFHERWNRKFSWTQWATGPKAMRASRMANVIVGWVLIVFGLIILGLAATVYTAK